MICIYRDVFPSHTPASRWVLSHVGSRGSVMQIFALNLWNSQAMVLPPGGWEPFKNGILSRLHQIGLCLSSGSGREYPQMPIKGVQK